MYGNETIIQREKKRRKIWVIVTFVIFAVNLAVSFGIIFAPGKAAKLVYDSFDKTYYASLNKSDCQLNLEFDRYVDYGKVRVRFFDSNHVLLHSETYKLIGGGYNETCYFYDIPGEVKYCDIVSCNAYEENYAYVYMPYIMAITVTITLTFFICSLCVKGKIYEYKEHEIFVFCGVKRHYMMVDGKMVDEYISIFGYGPIILETMLDDGANLKATISGAIKLKINSELVLGQNM